MAAEAAVKEYKETQQRLEVEREQMKQAGENASLSMHNHLLPCNRDMSRIICLYLTTYYVNISLLLFFGYFEK